MKEREDEPLSGGRIPTRARRSVRLEAVVVGLLLVFFVRLHVPLLVPGFGEVDAARMAVDAVAHHEGFGSATNYRIRTSPLYVRSLSRALDLGLPIRKLPRLMSWLSLISCAVALAAAYGLFRQLAGSLKAGLATGLLALTPAVWMGANYGMAHTPALAALLLATCTFSMALDEGLTPLAVSIRLALALVFMTAALCLKADFVLTGLALPGLAWLRRRPMNRFGLAGLAIVLIALGVQLLYSKSFASGPLPDSETLVGFAAHWHAKFPFTRKALFDKWVLGSITHSTGPFLFAVALVALAVHLLSRDGVRLGAWAAMSSLPTMVFWGLILGNSVRHNIPALAPLMLLVASLSLRITESNVRAVSLVVLFVATNYVSDTDGSPQGFSGLLARTNLIQLSHDQQEASAGTIEWTERFVKADVKKKAIVAQSVVAPAEFAMLASAEGVYKVTAQGDELVLSRGQEVIQQAQFVYCANWGEAHGVATRLRHDGYTVWLHDF